MLASLKFYFIFTEIGKFWSSPATLPFLPQLLLSNGLTWSFAKLENYLYSNKEWAIGLWISDFVSKQVRNMAQLCNLTNFFARKKQYYFFVKLHKSEGIFFVAIIFFFVKSQILFYFSPLQLWPVFCPILLAWTKVWGCTPWKSIGGCQLFHFLS